MKKKFSNVRVMAMCAGVSLVGLLAGCNGGGGGGDGSTPTATSSAGVQGGASGNDQGGSQSLPSTTPGYTLGGTLYGLSGGSVTLKHGANLPFKLMQNGRYSFMERVMPGEAYTASIVSQPTGQVCTLSNATGTVGTGNVQNIDVVCVASASTVGMSSARVITLAGTPKQGGALDGIGSSAQFTFPRGLAMGPDGYIYVADQGNSVIRKVGSVGITHTVAGNSAASGYLDANGTNAKFVSPFGVAVDAAGNVYVTDSPNMVVRKITPAGDVTTIAGSYRTMGATDGKGAAALFREPWGIVAGVDGVIYVTDSPSGTIRKITVDGTVTTFAGKAGAFGSVDGTADVARFTDPRGIATDKAGNLYVTDAGMHVIRKITPAGVVTTLAGLSGVKGNVDGVGAAARFNTPYGIAVDPNGNVIVADTNSNMIRKITPDGVVTTIAGTATIPGAVDGIGSVAQFSFPYGVTVAADGTIYVSDTFNSTIRRITF